MLSFVLLTPLLVFITLFFFGRFFSTKWAASFAIWGTGLAFIASCFNAYRLVSEAAPIHFSLGNWFAVGTLSISWDFLVDLPAAAMCFIVTLVSFCVNLYSREYMRDDPFIIKFFSYLALFSFFMLFLVCADNFVLLFFGWEGVGLVSYLLVGYWSTRRAASTAALKAVLVNRVGDFGLLFGALLCFAYTGSLSFGSVFNIIPFINETILLPFGYTWNVVDAIACFLVLGVAGKSAQFCLHTWLPDAMEGPTPVSALLHAATMVTAGVFVLLRCAPIFESSPSTLAVIGLLGAITAFFASTVGWFQNDLKKVIAFSTCSQLGYMLFAAGMSNYPAALLHLVNHAFFKALLFLSAGAVIHALGNEQDMRRMGGLAKVLPFTHLMMLTGSLSLAGLPFLTGFYSKEAILEYGFVASHGFWFFSGLLTLVATVVAVGSALYSVRSLYLVFYAKPSFPRPSLYAIHECPADMRNSMLILWVGTIFAGYFTHTILLDPWLWIRTANLSLRYEAATWYFDSHFLVQQLPNGVRLLPLCGAIIGGFLGYFFARQAGKMAIFNSWFADISRFSSGKWLFDWFYNKVLLTKALGSFAYNTAFKTFDRGVIELLGPLGLTRLIRGVSLIITRMQTGSIYRHMLVLVSGLIVICFIAMYSTYVVFTGDPVFDSLLILLVWVFLVAV